MIPGSLEAIWKKRAHGGPMDPVAEATIVEGKGIDGDANFGGTRHVTIIAREVFERIAQALPATPAMRRANLMVRGLDLENSRGMMLAIGSVRIRIRGETRPCHIMDEQCAGLREALAANWAGGVHGVVVAGGTIQVGDPVTLETEQSTPHPSS